MEWDAMSLDYRPIAEQGEKLKKMIEASKVVKITSASGTSLTFSIGNRSVSSRPACGVLEWQRRESMSTVL
jgi:leucyl aminopeptidase (aminopeptidase T)